MTDVMTDPTRHGEPRCLPNRASANTDRAGTTEAGRPPSHLRPSPWPFEPEDQSALAWWRTMTPESLHGANRQFLFATLRQISMLHGDDDFTAALRGDAAAAISVALAVMPITNITLQVDIAMTTLLRSALESNAASALVMAQVVGLTDFGHPFGTALAASWLDFGRRHSTDPRKFSEAEVVLWEAFREASGQRRRCLPS